MLTMYLDQFTAFCSISVIVLFTEVIWKASTARKTGTNNAAAITRRLRFVCTSNASQMQSTKSYAFGIDFDVFDYMFLSRQVSQYRC